MKFFTTFLRAFSSPIFVVEKSLYFFKYLEIFKSGYVLIFKHLSP